MIRVKMPVTRLLYEIQNGQAFIDSNSNLYLKISANQMFCFDTNTIVEKPEVDYSKKLTLVKLTSGRVMMNDEKEI